MVKQATGPARVSSPTSPTVDTPSTPASTSGWNKRRKPHDDINDPSGSKKRTRVRFVHVPHLMVLCHRLIHACSYSCGECHRRKQKVSTSPLLSSQSKGLPLTSAIAKCRVHMFVDFCMTLSRVMTHAPYDSVWLARSPSSARRTPPGNQIRISLLVFLASNRSSILLSPSFPSLWIHPCPMRTPHTSSTCLGQGLRVEMTAIYRLTKATRWLLPIIRAADSMAVAGTANRFRQASHPPPCSNRSVSLS
jgi:hypothetical protein